MEKQDFSLSFLIYKLCLKYWNRWLGIKWNLMFFLFSDVPIQLETLSQNMTLLTQFMLLLIRKDMYGIALSNMGGNIKFKKNDNWGNPAKE